MAGNPGTAMAEEVELGMTKEPIIVTPAAPNQRLHPFSRINFGKVNTVEWNVKVMDVGFVRGDSYRNLNVYFHKTINAGLGHSP